MPGSGQLRRLSPAPPAAPECCALAPGSGGRGGVAASAVLVEVAAGPERNPAAVPLLLPAAPAARAAMLGGAGPISGLGSPDQLLLTLLPPPEVLSRLKAPSPVAASACGSAVDVATPQGRLLRRSTWTWRRGGPPEITGGKSSNGGGEASREGVSAAAPLAAEALAAGAAAPDAAALAAAIAAEVREVLSQCCEGRKGGASGGKRMRLLRGARGVCQRRVRCGLTRPEVPGNCKEEQRTAISRDRACATRLLTCNDDERELENVNAGSNELEVKLRFSEPRREENRSVIEQPLAPENVSATSSKTSIVAGQSGPPRPSNSAETCAS